MSEIKLPQDAARPSGGASSYTSFLYRQLPHIVVLVLAISGVAYTNISHQPLVGYWEFLALAMAVVCVVTEWAKVDNRHARRQLILKQALHWGAILVAVGRRSAVHAGAGNRSRAFDAAGARRLPRRPQSLITPNLLSGCRNGCRHPRDRLA